MMTSINAELQRQQHDQDYQNNQFQNDNQSTSNNNINEKLVERQRKRGISLSTKIKTQTSQNQPQLQPQQQHIKIRTTTMPITKTIISSTKRLLNDSNFDNHNKNAQFQQQQQQQQQQQKQQQQITANPNLDKDHNHDIDIDQLLKKIHSQRRVCFQKKQQRLMSQKREIINYQNQKCYKKISSSQCETTDQPRIVELIEILGTGAYSTVKLAQNKASASNQMQDQAMTAAKYAIKTYEKYKLINQSLKNRVLRQISILSRLRHANIIDFIGAYESKRQIHMVFQYLDRSVTLQEYFKHNMMNISDSKFLGTVLKHATMGIAYLHGVGIFHRDIKADNIMLSFSSSKVEQNSTSLYSSLQIKLIDFGFATSSIKGTLPCGTPKYMAPELFQKKCQYDTSKVDIWALGVMFYYLIEGKFPFNGYSEKDLIRNIRSAPIRFLKTESICMQELILSMLNSQPRSRPSAETVYSKLNQIY